MTVNVNCCSVPFHKCCSPLVAGMGPFLLSHHVLMPTKALMPSKCTQDLKNNRYYQQNIKNLKEIEKKNTYYWPKQHVWHHLGPFSSSLPPTIVILITLSIMQLWSQFGCGCGCCVVVICCGGLSSSWLPWVVVQLCMYISKRMEEKKKKKKKKNVPIKENIDAKCWWLWWSHFDASW